MSLSISILVDNHSTRADLTPTAGFSAYVCDADTRLLFDTGTDDRVIDHAQRMGIDLATLDAIVLSHGHHDHTGGLPALIDWFGRRGLRPPLIAHPDAFLRRHVRDHPWSNERRLGPPLAATAIEAGFEVRPTATPLAISDRFCFLGEIPATADRATLGVVCRPEGDQADAIRDDSALVWSGRDGLVILSGCSHSGITAMIDHARAVTGCERVSDVVGGLHLQTAGPAHVWRLRQSLQRRGSPTLYACHCTGWARDWLPRQHDIGCGAVLHFV
ncbi:MAG: MBL fold metallo-hydrolase [Burkholderiaceae bacterium]